MEFIELEQMVLNQLVLIYLLSNVSLDADGFRFPESAIMEKILQ